MEVWISHSSLKQSRPVTIHLDRVAEAIEEAERKFLLDKLHVYLPLSAKFNGRTLGRDSIVPKTSFQEPLELFKGMVCF